MVQGTPSGSPDNLNLANLEKRSLNINLLYTAANQFKNLPHLFPIFIAFREELDRWVATNSKPVPEKKIQITDYKPYKYSMTL